ncbi:MAG: hypothetical protein QM754_19675 [Tepidisphaeraceae bacterium]
MKTLLGGVAMTVLQGLIAKHVAGRAAGVATRGSAGIPGLLVWLAVSYFLNRYLNRDEAKQTANDNKQLAAR